MLEIADCIIVHNNVMQKFFIEKGFDENKIVVLKIFDYLQDGLDLNVSKYEKSITIAGNLDINKCKYISQLNELEKVKVNLYGPNFDEKLKIYENLKYNGSFPPNELPQKLDKGFGLVWDGDSLKSCNGCYGQYLKYNNPHKTIPLFIIWITCYYMGQSGRS